MDPDNNIGVILDIIVWIHVWGELLVSNLWLCVILDDIIVWIHVWGEEILLILR
jgi:hypothetical protein